MVRKFQLLALKDIQILCISFCLLTVAFAAVQYYPAPQITSTDIGSLGSIIASKRLESFQFSQDKNPQNGTDQTTFVLRFYDRTEFYQFSSVKLVVPGKWSYIKGTKETLSCLAIYEETSQIYGLLSFNLDKRQLKIAAQVPFATINQNLSPNNTLSKAAFELLVTLGQNCEAGAFRTNFIRQTGGFAGFEIVKLPAFWNPVQITEDYKYAISGDKLYKYKEDLVAYDAIYNFNSTYNEYDMRVSDNKIIVSASKNTYIDANATYSVEQSFFILQDLAAGVKVIKIASYNGISKKTHFDFFASPLLTKLGLYYLPPSAASPTDVVLVGLSIDYTASTTSNLVFAQPKDFVTAALASNNMFDFSDRFILIRDYVKQVDVAFQFVGSQVKKFATRDMSYKFMILTYSERIHIDPYYYPYLVAYSSWKHSEGGYSFEKAFYGNYAATVRVKLPSNPPLARFQKPTQSVSLDLRRYEGLQFNYIDVVGSDSIVNKRVLKFGQADNLISYSTTINNLTLSADTGNPNCMIAHAGAEQPYTYYFLKFNSDTKKYNYLNLAALIGSETFSPITKGIVVSDTCDMISINQKIYYADALGVFKPIGNNLANFNWLALDNSFVYAYTKGFIWKFNSATKQYDNIYQFQEVLDHDFSQIFSFGNKFVMYAVEPTFNAKSYYFAAYREDNSKITIIGDAQVFDTPQNIRIQVSQDVTKVLLYALLPGGFTKDIFYIWDINYTPLTPYAVKKYPFVTTDFYSAQKQMGYQLFNNFIYIRQIGTPLSNADKDKDGIHFIYYLKAGNLKLVLKKAISIKERDGYSKSTTIISENNRYYLCNIQIQVDTNSTRFLTVPYDEFSLGLTGLDELSPLSGLLRDGKMYLCEPGCSECSSGLCTSCKEGYVLDLAFSICRKCAPGCKSCDSLDTNKCSSCYDGLYQHSKSCIACDANCATCTTTSVTCSTCLPEMFLNSDKVCKECPKYCKQCSDSSKCTTCRDGFVLTDSQQCKSCSIQCTSCISTEVTRCISCSTGLQMNYFGICVPCPTNCLTCLKGVCSKCASGYALTDAYACVLVCQLPCATCAADSPSTCTSCYGSGTLSNGTCTTTTTCNADSSCTECGQGLNYYLDSGKCTKCPTIQSCIQCGSNEPTTCTLCIDGFYVNPARTCTECGLGCKTCSSETSCYNCQPGFLLPASSGTCLKCVEPCLTCDGTPAYCTSCMDGYFKRGWKCLPEKYLAFSLAFPTTNSITAVGAILDQVIAAVLTAINQDVNNIDIVTILSMVSGSVQISAAVVPPAGITATTASQISAGLSGTTSFGGLTSGSLSVSVYTAPVNGGGSSSDSDSGSGNVGMIVGVVIGSVVFVAIVLAIIYFVYISKKSSLLVHSAESSNIIQENKQHIQVESFDGIQGYSFGNRINGK